MKIVASILVLLSLVCFVFAQQKSEVFQLNSKIGFVNGNDSIRSTHILNDERALLIGKKEIQIWNYRTGKLESSKRHEIEQFRPSGWLSRIILFDIPALIGWRSYVVHPDGKWLITLEKTTKKAYRTAVVRDLGTLDEIAVMKMPEVSIDSIYFDRNANAIRGFGETDSRGVFSSWSAESFENLEELKVDEFSLYLFLEDRQKVIVGSGGKKSNFFGLRDVGNGKALSLRDVASNKILTEFKADGVDADSPFRNTMLSKDGKALISTRDKSVFVWDLDGDGQPRFVINHESGDQEFVKTLGRRYIITAANENLYVHDAAGNGKPLYEIASATPGDTTDFRAATRDGEYLAVADDNSLTLLKTAGDGRPIKRFVPASETEKFKGVSFIKEKNLLSIGKDNRSEGKNSWTDFYSIETGELVSSAAVGLGDTVFALPDPNYLIDISVGGASIWNFKDEKALYIPLDFYQPPTYVTNEKEEEVLNDEMPYNFEQLRLSPDYKYILKFGGDRVSIFDLEQGEEIQRLFDADRVKYDKKTKEIKNSGLKDAAWTKDGKYVYAEDSKSRTVSFWKSQ